MSHSNSNNNNSTNNSSNNSPERISIAVNELRLLVFVSFVDPVARRNNVVGLNTALGAGPATYDQYYDTATYLAVEDSNLLHNSVNGLTSLLTCLHVALLRACSVLLRYIVYSSLSYFSPTVRLDYAAVLSTLRLDPCLIRLFMLYSLFHLRNCQRCLNMFLYSCGTNSQQDFQVRDNKPPVEMLIY